MLALNELLEPFVALQDNTPVLQRLHALFGERVHIWHRRDEPMNDSLLSRILPSVDCGEEFLRDGDLVEPGGSSN